MSDTIIASTNGSTTEVSSRFLKLSIIFANSTRNNTFRKSAKPMRIARMRLPTLPVPIFKAAKRNPPTRLIRATPPETRLGEVGKILVEVGVVDRTLPALATHRAARILGVEASSMKGEAVEVGEFLAHVAVYIRILASEILRALMPWKILCLRVVFGTRRAHSAPETSAELESARAAATTARLTTGVMIGPTAQIRNTRTS